MNIIKELYFGNISGIYRKRNNNNQTRNQKENTLYEKIKFKLEDDKALLDDYINILYESIDNDLIDTYIQGFKTGLLIGIECSNIEI